MFFIIIFNLFILILSIFISMYLLFIFMFIFMKVCLSSFYEFLFFIILVYQVKLNKN